ncbi:hypothetical protein AVEN_231091-1 [Araneus ventricosus]|uniref:Uncharacterized protein n=1 Tax=Araneus ventricosus TaxID=182803 RepID=A0A4Y2X0L0_ARAVE|nr:hypothetical protein AVEN_231091-1 [Araneus ventricosus]
MEAVYPCDWQRPVKIESGTKSMEKRVSLLKRRIQSFSTCNPPRVHTSSLWSSAYNPPRAQTSSRWCSAYNPSRGHTSFLWSGAYNPPRTSLPNWLKALSGPERRELVWCGSLERGFQLMYRPRHLTKNHEVRPNIDIVLLQNGT